MQNVLVDDFGDQSSKVRWTSLHHISGMEIVEELVRISTRPWSHASGRARGVVTRGLQVRQTVMTWLLLRVPKFSAYCTDKFDSKYKDSCEGGQWRERAYFDVCLHRQWRIGHILPFQCHPCYLQQESGECTTFWWDGCISTSQNFFYDLKACQSFCEHPGKDFSIC